MIIKSPQNRLIQNIFQMGNEENIEGLSEEDSHRLDLEDECFRLWDEVSALFDVVRRWRS